MTSDITKDLNRLVAITAALALVVLLLAAAGVGWSYLERRHLCQEVEVLKAQLRPEPFNLKRTQALLRDLGTDPKSERGKRLIRTGRENNRVIRVRLASDSC